MKHLNFSPEQVEAINHRYIRGVDKFVRMFEGVSSELIAVQGGVANLKIDIHSGWKRTNQETVKYFIENWHKFNEELQDLDGWEVWIYTSEKIAGFFIPFEEFGTSLVRKKIELFNSDPERNLAYVYRKFNDSNKSPKIILTGEANKYRVEFQVRMKRTLSGFFTFRDNKNYMISNEDISKNIFIIPHPTDDYLFITRSEDGLRMEVRLLKASSKPVCYIYRGTTIYLINTASERIAELFWNDYINQPLIRERIYINDR